MGGDATQMHPAAAVLDEHQDVQSLQEHGIPCRKSTARIPVA
jgi:hypothetical protein